jgi:hypothetical protein
MRVNFLVVVLLLGVLVGCGPQDGALAGDGPSEATEGQAGLTDDADRACSVVLRTAQRTPKNGGYEAACSATGCFAVWTAVLDVSALADAAGAQPYVQYRAGSTSKWSVVAATRTAGAPHGWVRYTARLQKDTISEGLSYSSLQNASLELAPYLLTTNGVRLFDHNRRPGTFDTYVLSAATGWDLTDDTAVCQAPPEQPPVLAFNTGWRTEQHGALIAGREAVLNYALERLPQCRGTHNGFPAWSTKAMVRFSPGGQTAQGPVVVFESVNGSLAGAKGKAQPFIFTIPAGTTSLETWFQNSSGAGSDCSTWDSNNNANYRFNVRSRPPAAVQWVGNAGSSFSRLCSRVDGVPEPAVIDSYVHQRACSFIEVDVYVPGLTDGATLEPEAVFAQAELQLDGKPLPPTWLTFVGRFGNDYRYRYQLPLSDLYYGPRWQTFSYSIRFSTDGHLWLKDAARTATRDASFVNPAWP